MKKAVYNILPETVFFNEVRGKSVNSAFGWYFSLADGIINGFHSGNIQISRYPSSILTASAKIQRSLTKLFFKRPAERVRMWITTGGGDHFHLIITFPKQSAGECHTNFRQQCSGSLAETFPTTECKIGF